MQQAKCTNCGAGIEVDEKQKATICSSCSKAIIVEEAIEEYEESLKTTKSMFKDQENYDKVNFRLKFGYVVSIIFISILSFTALASLPTFVISLLSVGNYYTGASSVINIIVYFIDIVILILLIWHFTGIVQIRNIVKYNKKKIKAAADFNKSSIILVLVMSVVLVFLVVLSTILTVNSYYSSNNLVLGTTMTLAVISYIPQLVFFSLLTKFSCEVKKIVENIK